MEYYSSSINEALTEERKREKKTDVSITDMLVRTYSSSTGWIQSCGREADNLKETYQNS
jgi:hypothetical protein